MKTLHLLAITQALAVPAMEKLSQTGEYQSVQKRSWKTGYGAYGLDGWSW
jgi:hypothetical protein